MNIEKYTLVELRQLAKERGIKNVSKLKKEELIRLLKNIGEENLNEISNAKVQSEHKEIAIDTSIINQGGYKLTNEDDQIVEGILEVLPDGYGFLRGENYLSTNKAQKMYIFRQYKFVDSN